MSRSGALEANPETAQCQRARWHAPHYSYARARRLAAELGVSEVVAAVLVRRGLDDAGSARSFLAADESHDALLFRGMQDAADLILRHIRTGSVIGVHGDYDVDGVCSTALVSRILERLGATVKPRLPSRTEEGYGLSISTVRQLRAQGVELLMTTDCGIGATEEVTYARGLGMDVVVTDHHRPGPDLPDCPLVHPALCGYPCADLCATGVAYKLAQALYARSGLDAGELAEQLDLVALATVADVVPLLGENRTLVKEGLRALAGTSRPGLRALMRVAGVEPQAITERTLAFALAPRINAAGRLYRPDASLELLLTEDRSRALEIARELDAINTERQAVETRILFDAERQLSEDEGGRSAPLFVLAGDDWHPGVIGIVASRLVERYHRPCVLIALDATGRGRGSGRSVGAYDLHAGLAASAGQLVRFGGHRMAAGLEIEAPRLERFRSEIVAHARAALTPEDLRPLERIDAVIAADAVGHELAEELEQLRPFGMGNPAVNFLLPAARLSDVRPMGDGRHARFTVRQAGTRARAVAFGNGGGLQGAVREGEEEPRDLVVGLELNEWQGAVEPRLVMRSLHPLGTAGVEPDTNDCEGCASCACRARQAEWWGLVWRAYDSDPVMSPAATASDRARTVVDRRGRGILGSLSELLSTGESLVVVCADVSRRRGLLERELDPTRFERPRALAVSIRCSAEARAQLGSLEDGVPFALTDYGTLEIDPSVITQFDHVFALDPPPFERLDRLLEQSAAENLGKAAGEAAPEAGTGSYLHLGWGPSESEFARIVVEQELGLRAPLAAVYRAFSKLPESVPEEALERALVGESHHPRTPVVAGRCLRILEEVGLLDVERSSATVRCTINRKERVNLEESSAFRAYSALYQEALKFLSRPEDQTMQRRAA